MADHGAQLQSYNVELVRYIEELRAKLEELARATAAEESERDRLRAELRALQERADRADESIARKNAAKAEFERTIREAEAAYLKILESSQMLLHHVKSESTALSRHLSSGPAPSGVDPF